MPIEIPELPDIPEIPELPAEAPINEHTVRALWNLARSLAILLQAEINTSRALAKLVIEDRENLANVFEIVQGHHTILGRTIDILNEMKGDELPPLDLPRLPPNYPPPENN